MAPFIRFRLESPLYAIVVVFISDRRSYAATISAYSVGKLFCYGIKTAKRSHFDAFYLSCKHLNPECEVEVVELQNLIH